MTKFRVVVSCALVLVLLTVVPGLGASSSGADLRRQKKSEGHQRPLIISAAKNGAPDRYFVEMKAPSAGKRIVTLRSQGETVGRTAQRNLVADARASQEAAVVAARSAGADVLFRYSRLVNAFSIVGDSTVAAQLAGRADVARVTPVSVVKQNLFTSVPFIGAPKVWQEHGVTGEGVRVAVVDTGVDYTHADFGGAGTRAAYNSNDPTVIESGSFPTERVVDGYDFVGGNYDVTDASTANDTPQPDPDPLDDNPDGLHGTHVAGICCGSGVPNKVGPGVAPDASILAYKVWHNGNSTADVLVAAYERAMDPDQNGNMSDAVDIIQFSGGVDYGTQSSLEAQAAQQAVDLGTVFVASAGNAGNKAAGFSPYIHGTPASAPGVISVAASIDVFEAQTTKVLKPKGQQLPSKGLTVFQDWSKNVSAAYDGRVLDARKVDKPAANDGMPAPTDKQLCKKPDGKPFEGKIALVFKGSTSAGDCDGTLKVLRAQQGGAEAVILWSGFAGPPFVLSTGEGVDKVNIPAWMVDTPGGEKLGRLASPKAADDKFSTRKLKVKVLKKLSGIPGWSDRITDFSSQGPERETNSLKPDIAAPGSGITSAFAGTGDGALTFDGTSMAAPHVSGAAALLLNLHPDWTPAQVKAVLMNQAKANMADVNGFKPVPATIQGAGRVRVDQAADAVSMAVPGSLSFGLQPLTAPADLASQTISVTNFDTVPHDYSVDTDVHYSDLQGDVASADVSTDGVTFGDTANFPLAPGTSMDLHVRLHVDPTQISPAEQENGLYYFHPDIDGAVNIEQSGGSTDMLRVPWHVVPEAASANSTSDQLKIPDEQLTIATPAAAGVDHADLYLKDVEDGVDSGGEEDIVNAGVRTFVGPSAGDAAAGLPTGADPANGIDWVTFLTNGDEPTEPIQFAIRSAHSHATTEAYEANVVIDVGNDGTFADQELKGDFLAVKDRTGSTCLIDLAAPADCARTYYPDYTNFNTNLTGIVLDAGDLGLTTANPTIGYYYELCTETFSGDVPTPVCESAGKAGNGDPQLSLNVIEPDLQPSTWVCEGFFGGPSCADPITVTDNGNGKQRDLLVLFPNNPPDQNAQVVDVK